MLLNLHIKNIALIDDINIDFDDNLNILTGETGAGKSIILGSVNIALGGKFSKDIVRNEVENALVELLFHIENPATIDNLKHIDVELSEDNYLLISRKLQGNRVINKINDETVTVSRLKEIAELVIDIHGQHDNQSLLSKKSHIKILDKYGHKEIDGLVSIVASLYKDYLDVREEIENNQVDEEERARQIDFLNFEISEIENANLLADEDDELQAMYKKMSNAKNIIETSSNVYDMTSGADESASSLISKSYKYLNQIGDIDEDVKGLVSTLLDIDNLLNEFNVELSEYISSMSFSDEEFKVTEDRLDLINKLKMKYGSSIEDILCHKASCEEKLDKFNSYKEYMDGLHLKKTSIEKELKNQSGILSDIRKKYAKDMVLDIENALVDLNFLDVQFDMVFEESNSFSEIGIDNPYFVISTNVGEKMKPLWDVASGGELSRIMLAIKSTFADIDDIDTLIFDEIDAGISGRTAQMVSEKLDLIGRNHQVICITHLPQIAAMADTHFIIEKYVENNKTITTINPLDDEASVSELSRLIGGVEITEAVVNSAKEMKDMAKRTKIY